MGFGRAPIILDPMQNSLYAKLDPLKGNLTVPSDRAKIEELYESLRPYLKPVSKVGYEGSRDSNGKMSGKGILMMELSMMGSSSMVFLMA